MGKGAFLFATASLLFLPCLAHAEDCSDCDVSGWGEMDITCPNPIRAKDDFKQCLTDLPEANVSESTDIDDFQEGYILLHGSKILSAPTSDSIKVFIYHQWAVDKQGQVYLQNEPE